MNVFGIKYINFNKIFGYEIRDQYIIQFFTIISKYIVFQHVGICWLI